MKDIEELQLVKEKILNSSLDERTKKIVLALIAKEILETRSRNMQIYDNQKFVEEVDDELNLGGK